MFETDASGSSPSPASVHMRATIAIALSAHDRQCRCAQPPLRRRPPRQTDPYMERALKVLTRQAGHGRPQRSAVAHSRRHRASARRRGVRPSQAHAGHDRPRAHQGRAPRRAVLVDLHPRRAERRAPTSRRARSSSTPGYARVQLEQIDIARRVIDEVSGAPVGAHRRRRARQLQDAATIGSLLGLEGGHAIENSLAAAPPVLRPRRALHDAHAQRDARLGRRRARQRRSTTVSRRSAAKSCAR